MPSKQPPELKLLLSLGYWFGSHSAGLLLHPYQSVRGIVRDNFYRPLVFLPGVSLLGWWLLGAIIARFNILASLRLNIIAQAIDQVGFKQYMFVGIFLWGMIFLILWQVLLGYLFVRFERSLGAATSYKQQEAS